MQILKAGIGSDITHLIAESIKDNEHIVIMQKAYMVDIEALKNYKFDDAPDHIRYGLEYLGRHIK